MYFTRAGAATVTLLACFVMLCLSGVTGLHAAETGLPELWNEALAIPAGDHAALVRFGGRCLERKRYAWARACYERVVQLGVTASHREALLGLIKSELGLGECGVAYERLKRLVAAGYGGFETFLDSIKGENLERQVQLVSEGRRLEADGEYAGARRKYRSAFEIACRACSGEPLIGKEKLRRRLALCRKKAGGMPRLTAEIETRGTKCKRCGKGKFAGYVKCKKCKGKGYNIVEVEVSRRRKKKIKKRCPVCGGFGIVVCAGCKGMGTVIDKLKAASEKAVVRFSGLFLRPGITAGRDLSSALSRVECYLLSRTRQELEFFRAAKVRVSPVLKPLCKALPSPLAAAASPLAEASARWGETSWMGRSRYLVCHACRFVRSVRPYRVLKGTKLKGLPDFERIPEIPFAEIAAFPDRAGEHEFVTTECILRVALEVESDPTKLYLSTESSELLGLPVFIWTGETREEFAALKRGWYEVVGPMSRVYDFDLREKLDSIPLGSCVRLKGRVLFNRDIFPAPLFEVWRLKVALTVKQRRLLAFLSSPVPPLPEAGIETSSLKKVLWTVLGVRLEVPAGMEGTLLRIKGGKAPLGLLLDEMAEAFSCDCCWNGRGFVLRASGKSGPARDFECVVSYLAAKNGSRVSVTVD